MYKQLRVLSISKLRDLLIFEGVEIARPVDLEIDSSRNRGWQMEGDDFDWKPADQLQRNSSTEE